MPDAGGGLDEGLVAVGVELRSECLILRRRGRRRYIGYRRILVEVVGRVCAISAKVEGCQAVADVIIGIGVFGRRGLRPSQLGRGNQLANSSAGELIPRRGSHLPGEVFGCYPPACGVVSHAVSGDSIPNSINVRLSARFRNFFPIQLNPSIIPVFVGTPSNVYS